MHSRGLCQRRTCLVIPLRARSLTQSLTRVFFFFCMSSSYTQTAPLTELLPPSLSSSSSSSPFTPPTPLPLPLSLSLSLTPWRWRQSVLRTSPGGETAAFHRRRRSSRAGGSPGNKERHKVSSPATPLTVSPVKLDRTTRASGRHCSGLSTPLSNVFGVTALNCGRGKMAGRAGAGWR